MRQKLLSWALGWFGCLLCLALLLPNHYQPWLSFHQEWMAAVSIAPLAAWTLWRQCQDLQPRLAWPVVAALLAAVLALAQFFMGRLYFFSDALMAALYWLLLAASVIAGWRVVQHDDAPDDTVRTQAFWLAWVAAGIVSWGMAMHQWLDLPYFGLLVIDLPPQGRPFANLGQPNHLATLLLLALVGVAFLFETLKISRWTAIGLVGIFCFGLAMTQSRSVVLGLGLWCIFFYARGTKYGLRMPRWTPVLLIGAYLVCTLAWPLLNSMLLLTDDAPSMLERTAPGQRVTYWLSALQAIWQRPWMGWGFGQITMAQQATTLDYAATHTFFSSAHNIVLDLALWMGVPATAVLFWSLGRHANDAKAALPSISRWAAWGGLACLAGHSLVEYPLFYAYFLVPAGFLLGVVGSSSSGLRIAPSWRAAHGWVLVACGMACLGLLAKLTSEYLFWEEDWRNARFQMQRYANASQEAKPDLVLLDQIAAMHHVARDKPTRHMNEADLTLYRKNAERYPSSLALLRHAYAAGLNGQPEAAARSLALLCSLHKPLICNTARNEWAKAAEQEWPELKAISFPPEKGVRQQGS